MADPPLAVILLTMVTSQIAPRPPVLSTPLLQVVAAAIVVSAVAPPASARELTTSNPTVKRATSERFMAIT